ncbi:hypothetical protein [Candidatus Rariloculus sp.]|uniref:hypothetical protein n=1 Tax=Candidatus Rariloculus sp. TaxID=3101265 RepID=UPI003D1328CA
MSTMTISNVSTELAAALKKEKRRRGLSLNRTVLALMEESLGVHGNICSNGLHRLAGTWSEDAFKQFEHAVTPFGEVDPEIWR